MSTSAEAPSNLATDVAARSSRSGIDPGGLDPFDLILIATLLLQLRDPILGAWTRSAVRAASRSARGRDAGPVVPPVAPPPRRRAPTGCAP